MTENLPFPGTLLVAASNVSRILTLINVYSAIFQIESK